MNNEHLYFRYDFTIPDLNLIIEFNGDDWHANPRLFRLNDTPHPIDRSLTASDIWASDAIKENAAKEKGFKVVYVWESDYKTNPEEVHNTVTKIIEECKKNTL